MKPYSWPATSGSDRWTKRRARSWSRRSRRTERARQRVVELDAGGVDARAASCASRGRTSVLLAKRAVEPPAALTCVKTDSTRCPAAAWTVAGRRRSSFQVTPWPPVAASMRRPVTMPVWLGRVMVSSCSVRALSVDAPESHEVGAGGACRAGPSLPRASVLSPSTEIATTESIGVVGRSRAGSLGRGSPSRAPGPGRTPADNPMAEQARRDGERGTHGHAATLTRRGRV